MRCDEFEAAVHDLEKFAVLDRQTREAALEHAQLCSRCAALKEAVEALEASLAALAIKDACTGAPESVEAAVREAFRANHAHVLKAPWTKVGVWALATAAVLGVAALGWREWKISHEAVPGPEVARAVTGNAPAEGTQSTEQQTATQTGALESGEFASTTMVDESGFVSLPYATPTAGDEEGEVVRVRMARGALTAFGLPVSPESADDVISVDFLVGEDGMPQAVRLSE